MFYHSSVQYRNMLIIYAKFREIHLFSEIQIKLSHVNVKFRYVWRQFYHSYYREIFFDYV
jgi:hypothetical protein